MNTSETRPLILVAGPTAGGKTGLAVDLAARLEARSSAATAFKCIAA